MKSCNINTQFDAKKLSLTEVVMDQQLEFESKRMEVREEILALKEQIPSARILNQLGKAFNPKGLSWWLSNIALLNLILIGPVVLIGLAFKETGKLLPVFMYGIIATESMVLGIMVGHIAVQHILDDIANRIIEKINTIDDLSKILLWLKQTWSRQNISAFALPFCLIWILLGVGAMSIPIHQFIGFGFLLWCVLDGLLAGVVFYIPLWASLLAFNLRDYQYEMNAFSPADSEVLHAISEILTKAIYIIAAFTTVTTLIITSSLVDLQIRVMFSYPLLVIVWMIIIALFLLTRSTLGAITNRAKWETLNKIQVKINLIEATGDLSDKDTAERLLRLADIHKQIMASKTNTFDLKSVSTLFSQLMLPLLGLLLGNLDKVLKLLSK
jgi:hypothetical protein